MKPGVIIILERLPTTSRSAGRRRPLEIFSGLICQICCSETILGLEQDDVVSRLFPLLDQRLVSRIEGDIMTIVADSR